MAQYENETNDVILQRMLERIADDVDTREGSVVWDMLSPASLELAQAYLELDNALTFGFATEETPSNFLDLRTAELGVTRKPAVKAVGQVTFTGTDGIIVAAGTRVSTDEAEPVYFVTTADGTINGGTVTVAAEAEVAGSAGNVAQGRIAIALGDVSGVTAVSNAESFDGGTDSESDESLLARYYDKVRKPATSGNAHHYEQWAKEVAGVGDAKVYPLANGPGTVKVVLLDVEKTAPPTNIVTDAATYIESVRPIGATVEVVGATETVVNVSATLTLSEGATVEEARNEFESILQDYLKTLAFIDPIVRYSKIASLLLDVTVVLDYANLTVNAGTANVTIADGAVAVVGTVSFA
ncbi:baseplate J/gp47 family protein [Cytobacillus oceanisediminis]|uniref:Baseplate J protein n=1 Tax=Cytobacillus oceanisediminis 2691 TaxID=1196031 RepID=A0A160MA44_9BACI|nr:baseplate J/gp47 family protein [Cytobacillus oceanisediminis]AND39626.1 baseplate J protein [Cytobacillus oceanisediminis 2691]